MLARMSAAPPLPAVLGGGIRAASRPPAQAPAAHGRAAKHAATKRRQPRLPARWERAPACWPQKELPASAVALLAALRHGGRRRAQAQVGYAGARRRASRAAAAIGCSPCDERPCCCIACGGAGSCAGSRASRCCCFVACGGFGSGAGSRASRRSSSGVCGQALRARRCARCACCGGGRCASLRPKRPGAARARRADQAARARGRDAQNRLRAAHQARGFARLSAAFVA